MSEEDRKMWSDLGMDLQAHDQLLDVLANNYRETYMSQENRPKSTQYFDFVMNGIHGQRVAELLKEKEQGRKIVGSYCVFVPEEIVQAANATLVGLCSGADFAMEEVEKYLPRNTCSLIKSSLGFKLGKVCPFLESADMIVGENTCDGKKKFYETFSELVPNMYVMDLPQVKSEQGKELMRAEFYRFLQSLQDITGYRVDVESLKQGIKTVNEKRKAIHRLQSLRKADPAPISGLDSLLANQIYLYEDPQRFTREVHKLCDELEERIERGEGAFPANTPRILITGCPMAVPNWKVPYIVESEGAVIVGEESCVGERGNRNLTRDDGESLDDLMEAVLDRYFQIDCAIFTPNQERTEHILDMAKRYQADGVIHYGLQFCQPYIQESFSVEKALQENDIPVLRLETDYSQEDTGQLRTRVEAFVEMLG